jgi:hypothetical protein
MLSILIPFETRERAIGETLASLVPSVVDGLVRDVTLIDRCADPALAALSEESGCRYCGHGDRRTAPLVGLRGEWLMFLRPGIVMVEPWSARLRECLAVAAGPGAAIFRLPRRARRGLAGFADWFEPAVGRMGAVVLPRQRVTAVEPAWPVQIHRLIKQAPHNTYDGCVADLRAG